MDRLLSELTLRIYYKPSLMFASDCALAIGEYFSMYAACSADKLMANGCGVAGAVVAAVQ